MPASVQNWFRDLTLLKHLPFNYFVPDESMLPVESIRFFRVDPLWVDCLLDGAFSIGRVSQSDQDNDAALGSSITGDLDTLSGCIMRSEVVSGWPNLVVDGYSQVLDPTDSDPGSDTLTLVRMDCLSPTTLLCLFAGEVQTVDIHQKPEVLHFGVDADTSVSPNTFSKTLRDADGTFDSSLKVDPLPWVDQSARVLDLNQLATDMQSILGKSGAVNSAQFALEMIEGVQKVRFAQGTNTT